MRRERGERMPTGAVRRGDRVKVRGRSLDIKAVRHQPAYSDRPSVVLVPRSGLAERIRAAVLVLVDRNGRERRRAERRRSR